MKFTIIFVIFAVAVVEISSTEFKCTPGVPYQENNCNTCFCTETFLLGCTEMACISEENTALTNCIEGTVTQKGCNTCTCIKDFGTICTNNEC